MSRPLLSILTSCFKTVRINERSVGISEGSVGTVRDQLGSVRIRVSRKLKRKGL